MDIAKAPPEAYRLLLSLYIHFPKNTRSSSGKSNKSLYMRLVENPELELVFLENVPSLVYAIR